MKIPILHLEDGFHKFEFVVKGKSLEFKGNLNYPDDVMVNIQVNKFGKNFTCEIDVRTEGHYSCDRCLASIVRPYHENFRLLFHIGTSDFETDEEDVVMLPPETVEIDFTDRLIEYLILTMPMKNLCKPDCKGICPDCGEDLNFESCQCTHTATDPRWEELRKLLK
jgi:uncharacterized protein